MGWYFDNWPRGQYFTHTLVGTRAEGAIAAAWAVMNYLGGKRLPAHHPSGVLDTRRALQAGTRRLGLATFGDPQLSILAYGVGGDRHRGGRRAHDRTRLGRRPRH